MNEGNQTSLVERLGWHAMDRSNNYRDLTSTAAKRIVDLEAALDELLEVAERLRGGDPNLDPERWYAARDFARVTLARKG